MTDTGSLRPAVLLVAALAAPAIAAACVFSTTGTGVTETAAGGSTPGTGSHTGSDSTTFITSGTGGATSTSTMSGGAGGTIPVFPYAYRRRIRVHAQTAALPADYSVSFVLDHGTMVGEGKSQASGDDVRVYRDDSGVRVELDRRLDPVASWNSAQAILWFRTTAAVSASSEDASYWLYYGNPTAMDPPSDGNRVYAIWTDFDDGAPEGNGWTFSLIGGAQGTTSEASSILTLSIMSGDIWDNADSFAFLHHQISGDFMADTRVSSMSGQLDDWSKMGGVMIRQSIAAGSKNRIMSPVFSAAARTNSFRLNEDGSTDESAEAGQNPTPEYERVIRFGDRSRAFYSSDGLAWLEDGTEIAFNEALVDPILVGIPACNLRNSMGSVTIDWFRVRKLVASEPTVEVGPEEQGPF